MCPHSFFAGVNIIMASSDSQPQHCNVPCHISSPILTKAVLRSKNLCHSFMILCCLHFIAKDNTCMSFWAPPLWLLTILANPRQVKLTKNPRLQCHLTWVKNYQKLTKIYLQLLNGYRCSGVDFAIHIVSYDLDLFQVPLRQFDNLHISAVPGSVFPKFNFQICHTLQMIHTPNI